MPLEVLPRRSRFARQCRHRRLAGLPSSQVVNATRVCLGSTRRTSIFSKLERDTKETRPNRRIWRTSDKTSSGTLEIASMGKRWPVGGPKRLLWLESDIFWNVAHEMAQATLEEARAKSVKPRRTLNLGPASPQSLYRPRVSRAADARGARSGSSGLRRASLCVTLRTKWRHNRRVTMPHVSKRQRAA